MIATITRKIGRFQRGIRRYGIFSSIYRFMGATFNRWFRARLCVWVWNAGEPLADETSGATVNRYDTRADLPNSVLGKLICQDGESFSSRMDEEFADHGVLWVATIDGVVAGYQWSRRGHFINDWHFELTQRDVVIFSTVTFDEFRGRGIAPTIMSRICRTEVPEGGRATADCMVWNTPSVRFIQKTGFTKVAERKPLPGRPD